ncbi:hypothetical protein WAI453_006481 [Rhynchosporium graminicola]
MAPPKSMGIIDSFPHDSSPLLGIAHGPINIPQVHTIDLSFGNFTHNSPWSARHDREPRNNHIRRHDRPIQDLDVVFDDCEFANYTVGADIDMAANESGFDDGPWAKEDVVGDFEGVV